jgi:hypothetical protein
MRPLDNTSTAVLSCEPYTYLSSLFPCIDKETFTAILNHELPAAELYKLDSRPIMASQWHLVDHDDSAVHFRSVPSACEIYRNLESLLVPLNTYFSILSVCGLSSGQPPTLPCHFFRYSSHLISLASQYEWPAVLLYHFAFFARRSNDMLQGRYIGWDKIEVDLMEELLAQHRKPDVSTFAFLFLPSHIDMSLHTEWTYRGLSKEVMSGILNCVLLEGYMRM